MKYTKPIYELSVIITTDVITSSPIDMGEGVTLSKIDNENASVYASAMDIFGIR